jgi:adenylate cyclase
MLWEVDEFHGANAGLIVAEIELPHEDHAFEKPDWLGEEVTSERRYSNSKLSKRPWSTWKDEEKNPS